MDSVTYIIAIESVSCIVSAETATYRIDSTAIEIHLGSQQLLRVCQGKTSILMVMTSAKILLMWLFCSKIYIQFTFFNTYFSTKLLFTNKRYHYACAREVSVYAIRSQINYTFSAVYSYFFSTFMWQWNKLWFQVLYHRISKILQCHIFKQLFFCSILLP